MLAALSTLVFPIALKSLIDQGFIASDPGTRVMALREHFFALFGVGIALGVFSALRFYLVSWLGERVTADLRDAVYAHVVRQSPEFFETTQTGEVLSRLTTDTTLVQTVVGSSLSMGLRNAVMGVGAMAMLIITNPVVMTQVLGILVLVVLPSLYFGRRVRRLSRDSQDRVADSSAIAAEVLNAIPVVQSYTQEARESERFATSTENAFDTAISRTRMRSVLVAFIISATFGALLWGLYQGTQAVLHGDISAGHLGQTVVYVIILVGSVAVISEVYGDLLRAAGATERLMELLDMRSPIASPARPVALAGGGRRLVGEPARRLVPLSVAAAARGAVALQPRGAAGRDGRAGRAERRRQEHRVPAAAALLRRHVGRGPGRRRLGPLARARRPARADRHRAAGQRDLLDQRAARTSATAGPRRPMRKSRRRPGRRSRTTSSRRCRTATRPSSASAACACRAGSASASASRARC